MQQEKSSSAEKDGDTPGDGPPKVFQISFSPVSFAQDLEHLSKGGRGRAKNQMETGENICITGKKVQKDAPQALRHWQAEECKGGYTRSEQRAPWRWWVSAHVSKTTAPGSSRPAGKE